MDPSECNLVRKLYLIGESMTDPMKNAGTGLFLGPTPPNCLTKIMSFVEYGQGVLLGRRWWGLLLWQQEKHLLKLVLWGMLVRFLSSVQYGNND
mmetsp:Transcript_1941/g.12211  ORF Transcript_1941/g.12211 Transcript_1941/m.12211 type:complete len:94 (-) Transcript_1941:696-977(-)